MVVHNFSNLEYRLKTEKHENRPTLIYIHIHVSNFFFTVLMRSSDEDEIDRIKNKIKFNS